MESAPRGVCDHTFGPERGSVITRSPATQPYDTNANQSNRSDERVILECVSRRAPARSTHIEGRGPITHNIGSHTRAGIGRLKFHFRRGSRGGGDGLGLVALADKPILRIKSPREDSYREADSGLCGYDLPHGRDRHRTVKQRRESRGWRTCSASHRLA